MVWEGWRSANSSAHWEGKQSLADSPRQKQEECRTFLSCNGRFQSTHSMFLWSVGCDGSSLKAFAGEKKKNWLSHQICDHMRLRLERIKTFPLPISCWTAAGKRIHCTAGGTGSYWWWMNKFSVNVWIRACVRSKGRINERHWVEKCAEENFWGVACFGFINSGLSSDAGLFIEMQPKSETTPRDSDRLFIYFFLNHFLFKWITNQ